MTILETHIVPLQKHPIRIQEYAVGVFHTLPTKSSLKKAIKQQRVTVNNLVVSTAKFIIGGETIALIASKKEVLKKPFYCKLEVLFEDDYLAIINKPAGVLVSGNSFKTIDNALMNNLQKSTQKDAVPPKPVHRLDFPTTGILLIGKTANTIRILNKLFEEHKIQKTYLAVAIGKMRKEGIIESPIDKKSAYTAYKVLQTVASKRFQFLNLVQLTPKTGRRHQLRKHLSTIGNAILGDVQYGKAPFILKKKGLYLHASSLEFAHPITQEKMVVYKENPSKFDKIFNSQLS